MATRNDLRSAGFEFARELASGRDTHHPGRQPPAGEQAAGADQDLKAAAFKFVQGLASDLSKDELDLPGFPDTVAALHRALASDNSSVKDIVRLVISEPALAARLVKLANSAAFNTTGREVSDTRVAVTQLGFNLVRSTATAFAMRQMEQQEWLKPVRPALARIWRRSNSAASICHVIAAELDGLRPDEALATGLFHQLGNLYLLTKAHGEGLAVGNNEAWDDIVQGWHPTIARAFVEAWGMPEHVAEAIENQDAVTDGTADQTSLLTRLLSAAKLYASLRESARIAPPDAEARLAAVTLCGKSFPELLAEHQDAIATVRMTLG